MWKYRCPRAQHTAGLSASSTVNEQSSGSNTKNRLGTQLSAWVLDIYNHRLDSPAARPLCATMKLSHFILLPYALASALVVPNNITFSITEQRVGQNQTVKPFCAGGLDYHPPTTWKAKREPKKDMSPKEQAENDAEIKRVADGGITFGRPRAWRVRPWLKPDQYSEDWFNADFELCRYSIPLTDVEGCVVFRGLEWLLFGVTHTATQISSTDGDVIFQSDWLQRGPTTVSCPAMLRIIPKDWLTCIDCYESPSGLDGYP